MLTAYLRRGLTLAVGLGVGVGLMAGAVFVAAQDDGSLTDAEVVARARTLGMVDATELPKPAPAPAQQPVVTKVAVVPVPEGASFGEVAATLKAVGLIKEVAPFLDRASARKAAGALKVGVHEVPMTGLTDDQLIDLLTSLPSS